jgi:hypothetical protein
MACVECSKLVAAHARALRVHGLAVFALDIRLDARCSADIVALRDVADKANLDSEIAYGKLELHWRTCSGTN